MTERDQALDLLHRLFVQDLTEELAHELGAEDADEALDIANGIMEAWRFTTVEVEAGPERPQARLI